MASPSRTFRCTRCAEEVTTGASVVQQTGMYARARDPRDPLYGEPGGRTTLPPRISLAGMAYRGDGQEIHRCGAGESL